MVRAPGARSRRGTRRFAGGRRYDAPVVLAGRSAANEVPVLAWVEHALPGDDASARAALAVRHGLALEVANRDELDLAALRRSGARVASVQAWGLHEAHALSPTPGERRRAREHLLATVDLARELGAPRVVAVCGFGHEPCAEPHARSLELFASVADRAREVGVRVLVEPLSPARAGSMNRPEDVARLLEDLAAPDVFGTVLDTGHLLDGGHDPAALFAGWPHRVDEVQLKGPRSSAPDDTLPVVDWLRALPAPPDVVAVEHRERLEARDFERRVARLVALVARARSGARAPGDGDAPPPG
jgi:sugar phosphate isomerase/epimerase